MSKKSPYLTTKGIDQLFLGFFHAWKFIAQFFRELFSRPFETKEIIRQCYEVGVRSLPLITLTGFVTGIVFTKQSRPSLQSFGASSWLPSLITIAIIRALAPLVTALICAGKVGSNIGAELGSMKVTEQIDAMEVSAINPFKFLVVTRVLACTLMVPVLAMYSGFVGLMGSFLNVNQNEYTTYQSFIKEAFSSISFLDIYSSLFKAIVFGFTVGIVSCYQGYNAGNGTQGVGRAANSAVVISMFLVFIEEIVIVQVINWMR
ncbi:MAG: MlaE family ABC transporter permease [Bacteroidota bacterium]|nr:ABC transporter permease [Bacteroidota bacterium]GDX47874.1 putative ABC transporter permease protein [Bacteroidota bacterium]